MRPGLSVTVLAVLLLQSAASPAEDDRAQYPHFLANSYFDVGVGYIDYPFSARQLEPGFRVESVHVPHAAARVVLLGYRFNDHLAVQLSYMRPVEWVAYNNVNGVPAKRTVWMNLTGLTFRGTLPLAGRLSIDGEGGLGTVTRHGFQSDGIPIVKDANYWTALLGGGVRYRLNGSWDLGAHATYSPSRSTAKQPHTLMLSGGFTYNMRPLPEERVAENSRAGFAFPRDLVQVGYTTDALGYGVNRFVSGGVPIFWGGLAQVNRGVTVRYHRNVFHTRKVFSLDLGASVASWRSRVDRQTFYTASVFPEFRFTPLRLRGADLYLGYSLAGPTSISRVVVDAKDTGRHFTLQDFMAIGIYLGKDRHVNAELHIAHYSNGNVFPQNAGVSIPLTFDLGYAFH
jgi:Outer membrane protein beta-barrel domain/Lipid A 3-O-deacylase (PagL)